MRRSDREVTDKAEIIRIIEKCDVCHLALSRNNIPYIVPMNFGFDYLQGVLTLYFHGAKEGTKLQIISENPVACFQMDCSRKLIEAEQAGNYTMEYESVVGNGTIFMCDSDEEKLKALRQLMKTYAKDRDFQFSDSVLDSVTVFKLVASDFTGKRLKKNPD